MPSLTMNVVVNGRPYERLAKSHMRLLDFLRASERGFIR